MRIIAAIGRFGMDIEMVRQPKGKATITSPDGIEVHEVHSDTDVVPHIIGFISDPDEDD